MVLPDVLYRNLKKYFGYKNLRPRQKEVLENLFAGNDILAILPTGSGKSLCYQLPATYLSGLVIVVSPLIALMKDQVDSLNKRKIKATYINSSLTLLEQRNRLNKILQGYYDIIYVAPERFESDNFVKTITKVKVDLFAIDEAHCISEWGHDFRPSYMKLGVIRQKLDNPRLIALTATATPEVREDIINGLELRDFKLLVKGFDRRNLYLEVKDVKNEADKKKELLEMVTRSSLPVVIYVGTRNRVEEIVMLLKDKFSVIGYHGGMNAKARKRAQELFMKGKREVVVATNAFGMGVDKSNIRLVIHYELPGTLEAYYQEAGRAGRDGYASKCILLYHQDDIDLRQFFIESDYPERRVVESVYSYCLRENKDEILVNLDHMYMNLNMISSRLSLEASLRLLRREGYLKRIKGKDGEISFKILERVDPKSLDIDYYKLYKLKENKYNKLIELKGYIETSQCRHNYILNYFGDEDGLRYCPGCDNCNESMQKMVITKELGIVVQKILSCVIKLGGRFGITTVVKVLLGSKSKKILNRGLDKVSTYAIINDYTYDEVIKIIKELINSGYLIQEKGRYPTVKISKAGYKILHQPYNLNWDLKLEAKEVNNLTTKARTKLLSKLKKLRSNLAQLESKPPFMIAHDKTLEELVVRLPQNKEQILRVNGFGPVIYNRYGEKFLKEINEFLNLYPLLKEKKGSYLSSTYNETFLLYQQGLSLEEIAKKRDLAVGTIVDHLIRLIEDGRKVDLDKFISQNNKIKIIQAIEEVGYEKLKTIKEKLDDDVSYEEIGLVVAKYKIS
ncbi:RecQ family ATP-dependent DNA helicase [Orenia marismortui]|uniref:RecQ family ATP-dependent DNA helicase n=1 Tax=Orenia marismortui TaxID=46469 RepID=UPI000365EA92|nr:ATP-dependent DNA helicase RecQ [Orenia marismortui]